MYDYGKISIENNVQLILQHPDININFATLNTIHKQTCLIVLEYLTMKDMSLDCTDQLKLKIDLKFDAGRIKSEMDYLKSIYWKDELIYSCFNGKTILYIISL